MNQTQIIQGRPFGAQELAQVQALLTDHPDWSRRRLSLQLAQLWAWRTPTGQLKDMAARTLLLKLEGRGWIQLPTRRHAPPKRMGSQCRPGLEPPPDPEPLRGSLASLLPLSFTEVSAPALRSERTLFKALLQQYHYLSYHHPVGQNLQYLVRARQGTPVACVLLGAAAWQCAARDRYVGWDASTRARQLPFLANNTRFLILPWVRVPALASHVLSRMIRQMRRDWQAKYGHPLYLLETFVQCDRFAGTAYQAANWVWVGQTKGRSRQDRADGKQQQVPIKDIYLYPLHPRFRQRLQGESVPLLHPSTPPHYL